VVSVILLIRQLEHTNIKPQHAPRATYKLLAAVRSLHERRSGQSPARDLRRQRVQAAHQIHSQPSTEYDVDHDKGQETHELYPEPDRHDNVTNLDESSECNRQSCPRELSQNRRHIRDDEEGLDESAMRRKEPFCLEIGGETRDEDVDLGEKGARGA
jgi:uncharacterized membrane protein YccC